MESMGEYVNLLRIRLGISVRELARRVGCTAPFMSDVIHGRRFPSDAMLKEFAKALGVSERELKARDHRPPLEGIRHRTRTDPQLGIALRSIIDSDVTGKDLIAWLERRKIARQSKD